VEGPILFLSSGLRPGVNVQHRASPPSFCVAVRFLLALMLLMGVSITPGRVNAQTSTDSGTAGQSCAAFNPRAADDQLDWLFPLAKLDESLPR
jgi:hypothetical protein